MVFCLNASSAWLAAVDRVGLLMMRYIVTADDFIILSPINCRANLSVVFTYFSFFRVRVPGQGTQLSTVASTLLAFSTDSDIDWQ